MREISGYDRVRIAESIEDLWRQRADLMHEAETAGVDVIVAMWRREDDIDETALAGQRAEMIAWLEQLPIISVVCLEGSYEAASLEMIMSFDIRIAAGNTQFIVNGPVSQLLEEKCRFAIGQRHKTWKLKEGQVVEVADLLQNRIVSLENDIEDEAAALEYLQKIMGEKSSLQIRELKACFMLYRRKAQLDRKTLLQREAEAFSKLVINGEK